MRIVRDHSFTTGADRGASAAIGSFDGVHIGHRHVIEIARAAGARIGAPLGVLTFEPHPREFFASDAPPFRLMSAEARAHRLEKIGVARLYELPFNAALSGLSPHAFASEVLAGGLGLRHVVVGADFCFGKGRAGTATMLQDYGAEMGFGVTIAPLLEGTDGQVSSTAIRTALSEGRPRDAAAMLGHWHRIEGPVMGGEQRGRTLGFPTANMSIAGLHHWASARNIRAKSPTSKPSCSISPAISTARISPWALSRISAPKRHSTGSTPSSLRWMPIAPARGRSWPRYDRHGRSHRPQRPAPPLLGDHAPRPHDKKGMGGALRRLRQMLPQQAGG